MQKVLFPLTSVAQERCSSSSLLKNEQDNRDTAPLSVVKFCNSLIHSLTIANCCKLLPSPVNDIPLYVNSCQRLPCSLRVQNVVESLQMITLGAFHSTKIPVRNFGNSTCLMGRYIPVGYFSCKQDTKERYWGQHFVKWKGSFRSDQLKWPDQSKWTTFKADPEYSGRTKPKWSVPLDVSTEFSGILGWMESAPCLYYFDKYLSLRSRRLKWIWAQEKTGRARLFFLALGKPLGQATSLPSLVSLRPAFFSQPIFLSSACYPGYEYQW